MLPDIRSLEAKEQEGKILKLSRDVVWLVSKRYDKILDNGLALY